MSPTNAPGASARPTFADAAELAAFGENLRRHERGEIDAEAWRSHRVARGVYGQRQDGVHMLRIKLPQGAATAPQLRVLAEVTSRFSRGFGHVTTRQDFQLHFVKPADLEPALRRLASAGITTSGAGGNTVRNVVACPFAGVSPDEIFDVAPYAEAFARHFLRHPLGHTLPRKLKVAFEGCAHDHVATAIHDLGFRARMVRVDAVDRRGFSVTIAGGTSSLCTSGTPLLDFLPAGEVLALGEAVVRVFHARGDRMNKQRNRLKFLVSTLGFEPFRRMIEAELERIRAGGIPPLPFDPERPPAEAGPRGKRPPPPSPAAPASRVRAEREREPCAPPPARVDAPTPPAAFDTFRRGQVVAQRQPGYSTVTVSLPQGDVTAAQLEALAHLALAHGDGTVRFTPAGHVVLRWIPAERAAELFVGLAAAGLARDGAGTAADVVACPGAEVCRQAVTRTRDLARAVEEEVRTRVGAAVLSVPLPVHVSGCPNGCSQHHLAAIGLQGGARRLGGRAVPQYFVLLGGEAGDGTARFARLAGKVPARRVPEMVAGLVSLYLERRRQGETAASFFARKLAAARRVIAPYEELSIEDARPLDFVEPGATEDFHPETAEGECAA